MNTWLSIQPLGISSVLLYNVHSVLNGIKLSLCNGDTLSNHYDVTILTCDWHDLIPIVVIASNLEARMPYAVIFVSFPTVICYSVHAPPNCIMHIKFLQPSPPRPQHALDVLAVAVAVIVCWSGCLGLHARCPPFCL